MSSTLLLPLYYIKWHYTRAFSDIVRIWLNYLWFFWRFFSIPLLLRTLFAPWRGLEERKKRGFDLEDLAGVIVVNVLMRLVGAFIRLTIIIFGLVTLACVVVVLPVFLLVWAVLPVLLVVLFVWSLSVLVNGLS